MSEIAGYLGIQTDKLPDHYNAGFSIYVAAWPLVENYPGNKFQTGLFGTWMFAQHTTPPPTDKKLYSDIEGGLGWWRDTRFATQTPKFIMGGVALNFSQWANGPGAGKNRDWDHPLGLYGVAQLSPYVLWPPDGLNLRQGTCGKLWGYGYLPLPLIRPKATTSGKDVPTGGNCWTLFLNTANFKGPVAFFTPYFFSSITADQPELAGLFLDSCPSNPNRHMQMETQYIPAAQATDHKGETYARIGPTSFPRNAQNLSPVLHLPTVYTPDALSIAVDQWLNHDSPPVSGTINMEHAALHKVIGENRASWAIYQPPLPREERTGLEWKLIATGTPIDDHTFGYRWNPDFVAPTNTPDGPLFTLPEYYRLTTLDDGKKRWVAIHPQDVPPETGLSSIKFAPNHRQHHEPYVTPSDAQSCWKKPGPVAGPFKAKLGDGSTVVYHWYRFADQPALLNADLSDDEREALQKRVEKLHAHWEPDGEYLAPPGFGELAHIDPALVVRPPKGLEVGFVPIVTWQGIED
ncbi:MAG: hypothetical protein GC164_06375 [Phycisphaera sp.]|nr:hypothetical protein [Phycisphaera sp.]